LIFLVVLGYSCKKEDAEPVAEPMLNISRSTVDVGNDAGFTDTVIVHSNVEWSISLSDGAAAWISVDPIKSESADSTIVKITVTNTSTSPSQVATITITPANPDLPSRQINVSRKSYSLVWQKCFGGSDDDYGNETAVFPNGRFVTVGYTDSNDGDLVGNSVNPLSGWLLGLAGDASKVWQKLVTYLGAFYASVVANADGSSVSVGYYYPGNTAADFLITKLEANGNLLWSRAYGGTNYDHGSNVIATADGGYLVAGITNSQDGHIKINHGGYDIWVLKLDANGTLVWEKSFGGSGDEYVSGIALCSDGGYMLNGATKSSNSGDVPANRGRDDIFIVKIDASGNKVWTKTYGGSLTDASGSIISDASGGFIVTGTTNSSDGDLKSRPANSNVDMWTFKINNDGEIVWQTILGGSEPDWGNSLVCLPDGKIAVLGGTLSADGDVTAYHGSSDLWVVVLSSTGKKLWQRSFGSSGIDHESHITATTDGSLLVTGETMGNDGDVSGNHGIGYNDIWLFKLQ
jgi:hypothetical protein